MGRFKGVILDVDGTLVDSNEAHAHSWVEALAENRYNVPVGELRKLIGMGGDKLLVAAAGLKEDSPEGKRISKRRQELFLTRYLPKLQAQPGARELLRHMHSQGLRLAVASSAKKDELEPLLKLCGADEVIEHQTSSDDAERSKPDPDIVQAALKKLGLPPREVVMLGDTPHDVESAGRARVAVIAFRCGGWPDKDLAGVLAIYDNPADLLAHYEASPLGAAD